MSKYIFALLFVFMALFAFPLEAQQGLIEKHVEGELTKAKALIGQSEYAAAVEILHQAGKECQSANYERGEAEAWYLLGHIEFLKKAYPRAYQYWKSSVILAQNSQNIPVAIKSYLGMGGVFYTLEDFHHALFYYQKADSLIYYYHRKEIVLPFNERIAVCYFKKGDYNNALLYYSELLKYSIQYQSLEKEIIASKGIAAAYEKLDDYSSAIAHLKRLIPVYKRYRRNKELTALYFHIAEDYSRLPDRENGKRYVEFVLNSHDKDIELEARSYLLLCRLEISDSSFARESETLIRNLSKAEGIIVENNLNDLRIKLLYLKALMYSKEENKKEFQKQMDSLVVLSSNFRIPSADMLKVYGLAVDFYHRKKKYRQEAFYEKLYNRQYQLYCSEKEAGLQKEIQKQQEVFNMFLGRP